MAAGAIVTIFAPEPIEKALGAVIVAAGAFKARELFLRLLTKKLNTLTIVVNNVLGTNDRSASSISFQHNIAQTVPFSTKQRGLVEADVNKTQPSAVIFF